MLEQFISKSLAPPYCHTDLSAIQVILVEKRKIIYISPSFILQWAEYDWNILDFCLFYQIIRNYCTTLGVSYLERIILNPDRNQEPSLLEWWLEWLAIGSSDSTGGLFALDPQHFHCQFPCDYGSSISRKCPHYCRSEACIASSNSRRPINLATRKYKTFIANYLQTRKILRSSLRTDFRIWNGFRVWLLSVEVWMMVFATSKGRTADQH